MRKMTLKEGPLVFLRNVLAMEIIAAIALYIISFLENWQEVYTGFGLAKILRYDIFLMLAFSVFQLFYITLLFLDWYFAHYEITEREITKKSGLLFRSRKSVSLADVVSVEIYNSPLGRLMKHATIILDHGTSRVTKIKNIQSAEEYAHIIKQLVQSSSRQTPSHSARHFMDEGEGRFIEFKETLRYDSRKNEVNKEMERMAMKTVVAFLNAEGGTLLIGVNDDGEVLGLERDYKTLPKKNRDGFENHVSMLVKTMIGLPFTKYVGVKFEKLKDAEVCIISVGESHKPAYLKNQDGKEDFFVRVGNSTQPFSMSETAEYIKTRFKN